MYIETYKFNFDFEKAKKENVSKELILSKLDILFNNFQSIKKGEMYFETKTKDGTSFVILGVLTSVPEFAKYLIKWDYEQLVDGQLEEYSCMDTFLEMAKEKGFR